MLALVAGFFPLRNLSPAQPAPPEWRLNSGGGVFSNHLARPLRYIPDHGDFVIENGEEFFNRPLYCRNTAFRVDGGDKPEFSLYVPGRGGNLRFGLRSAAGAKWLNDAQTIVTRYRPGSLLYEIRDPLLGGGVLRLTVLPLAWADGVTARVEWSGKGAATVDLISAFGGANGMRGRRGGDIGCETEPISRFFQLQPEQCRSNEFVLGTNGFILHSRVVDLAGMFFPDTEVFVADAGKWNSLNELLGASNSGAMLPVVVACTRLRPGKPVFVALQRVEREVRLAAGAFKTDALAQDFVEAEALRRTIAERVAVETPDPFINAAAGAINVASDAIWDEAQGVYMHGAVAWRNKLLGWRGPYTADALGWHDRAQRHLSYWAGRQNTDPIPDAIPSADPSVNLARNEPALHSNGDLSNSHYDMNLVYIDALLRHLLWTGDVDLARREWPVIERHLAWERRLFRRPFGPEQLPLYEAYNCIWASDNMQFNGGGATHSTAYNYYHNRLAARLAVLLGKDPLPYEREANAIQKAMRQYLWLGDRGWFAEWKDYLGLQLAHPNAGLWTFYHTLDSEVPTPFEAWQMTRFVDTQIAQIPVGNSQSPIANSQSAIGNRLSAIGDEGRRLSSALAKENLFTLPTTSWMPYMWSLNNVVMAEVAHTSLGYWQANRPDAAFSLFKGCLLDSMFLGTCPGNVGMSSAFDMARGEAQRDFGDAIGICSRTMIEGLFGVHPDVLAGELRIRPGFPAAWDDAKLQHPDFNFEFRRDDLKETYRVESSFSRPLRLRLQLPALRTRVRSVLVNGRSADWRVLEDEVGMPRVEIVTDAAAAHKIIIMWKGPEPVAVRAPAIAASGVEFRAQFGAAKVREVNDPEGALRGLKMAANQIHGIAAGTIGHRTVFAQLEQGDLRWWEPVAFEIRPPLEILRSETQDADHLRFRVRNNTAQRFRGEVAIRFGKASTRTRLELPASGESAELALPVIGLLNGTKPVVIDFDNGRTVAGIVTNWKLQPEMKGAYDVRPVLRHSSSKFVAEEERENFDLVNLEPWFNGRVSQIFRNDYVSPRSPFCSLAMPKQGIGGWSEFNARFDVDDSGLRAAARTNGGRFVVQGVPFGIPVESGAKNILFTSQWDNYPREISVGLSGRASHVYLLMAGSSNPMESRFDNGEVIVSYTDGSSERLALDNPGNWWPIDQDYFTDDFAFRRPEPIPPRVELRTGRVHLPDPEWFKGHGGRIPGGAATVLDLPLNPGKELKSVTVRALANEVVIGLMAATLAR